jgi:hypothetical protein
MSEEEINIAIAEACGWKTGYRDPEAWHPLPDFLHDLNAMHEAEKVLDYNQMNRYQNIELSRFVHTGTTWICSATASQRAEAFLRTIGKWEDAK